MITVKNVLTSSVVFVLAAGLAADARAQAAPSGEGLPICVAAAKWSSEPVPGQDLWSAGGPGGVFVAFKTNKGNFALLTLSVADTLVIQLSQLFDAGGTLTSKKEYLRVAGGSTFDLDTGAAASDATADLKWNTAGGKSLQPVNDAMIYACRPSDRRVTPQ